MNAGSASSMLSQGMLITGFIIKAPTMIKAGAVAAAGTIPIMGRKNRESRKQAEVTRLARPVLPPTATPDADSTKVVTVEVPKTAPATVPMESARSAFSARGSLPSLFRKPAFGNADQCADGIKKIDKEEGKDNFHKADVEGTGNVKFAKDGAQVEKTGAG